jgi:hypothetical protein
MPAGPVVECCDNLKHSLPSLLRTELSPNRTQETPWNSADLSTQRDRKKLRHDWGVTRRSCLFPITPGKRSRNRAKLKTQDFRQRRHLTRFEKELERVWRAGHYRGSLSLARLRGPRRPLISNYWLIARFEEPSNLRHTCKSARSTARSGGGGGVGAVSPRGSGACVAGFGFFRQLETLFLDDGPFLAW